MQQRFSKNEMKKYQITQVCTAADLSHHAWLTGDVEDLDKNKKGSQLALHNDG
jgi:hypothetical protein